MEEKRNCCNCKHFNQYFTKWKTRLLAVNKGYCKKSRILKTPTDNDCRKWEAGEIEKRNREQSIKKFLLDMAERIEDIATILKDDNT